MTDPKPPSDRDEQQEQEKWYERTRYLILLFVGGIALFGLVLGLILDWYIDPQTSTQKKDLVQALGLITAGVAGAVGIFFTWRGQRITLLVQERNQRSTQEQLVLTRRGQITERFTQAIEQLGSESLQIRLGGIYSLERTARESRTSHWPIMEVFSTYVRTHAPRNTEKDIEPAAIKPDIQAILTVVGRRSVHHKEVEYGSIDLHATELRLAILHEANLSEANLSEANLEEADLSGADLSKATLTEANLSGANLSGANLEGADLAGARLWTADPNIPNVRNLTREQLKATSGDENTELPPHLKPPAHWDVEIDEQNEGT